ncbi:MAG TPA: toll/interleukin-1 receptor domain-containing protein [Streptosporangiaceae bacterium]|nr:toll/interleukin-1 receptor domain-containing protein [Streptosporangiaceae bacterium]
MLFLSYAEEDNEVAGQIARWLESKDFDVFRWEDPRRRGREFIRQIEGAIHRSDAFLILLSPAFLASDWCRRERDFAMRLEQRLQRDDPDRRFIHVLHIVPTPDSDAGFLGNYDWLDLTNVEDWEESLEELIGRLWREEEPAIACPREPGVGNGAMYDQVNPGSAVPRFRNREDELEKVLRGVTNASGPHFWLVIAPPQLGKTWFLRRIAADPGLAGWVRRLVDLRDETAEVRASPAAVLGLLFGLEPPVTVGPDAPTRIAKAVAGGQRPHLCLLDGAELMDRQTAVTVRSALSQVYRLVQEAGNIDVRLSLIVASRRKDEWRGVTPPPRVSQLPLTEFSTDVVEQALRDLGEEMKRVFRTDDYKQNALRAHRLTEGLPALLVRCLDWIKGEQWLGLQRLGTQGLFDDLTGPYIQNELLARQSLFPGGQADGDEALLALAHAFRVLAPYRFFTRSHLSHHYESDEAFSRCLRDQHWNLEHLSKAISGTALLWRPLDEPWQEIHPAIRRLLYRHYYRSEEQQAQAHSEARKFVEIWALRLEGKEQVVVLVESLWHEANVLRLRNPAEMEQRLSESARTLSRALQSPAYTVDELREYATERIRSDEELEETVSAVDGLFTRLVEIVATPL